MQRKDSRQDFGTGAEINRKEKGAASLKSETAL